MLVGEDLWFVTTLHRDPGEKNQVALDRKSSVWSSHFSNSKVLWFTLLDSESFDAILGEKKKSLYPHIKKMWEDDHFAALYILPQWAL